MEEHDQHDHEGSSASHATQIVAMIFVTIVMAFLYIKIIFF